MATVYHFNLTLSLSYFIVYRFIFLSLFYVSRLRIVTVVKIKNYLLTYLLTYISMLFDSETV